MASFTLAPDIRFHVGDTIYCYTAVGAIPSSTVPVTSSVVAANGRCTFTGVDYSTRYLAGKAIAGPFVAFQTEAAPALEEDALEGTTVDTFEQFKIILFADGTVRSVPLAAVAPEVPTGVGATARLSSVRIFWDAMDDATQYVLYRTPGGVISEEIAATSYRDLNIEVSETYEYFVQAVDQYGQRSPVSGGVEAYIDPALNVAPVVEVRAWPPAAPTDGRTYLRVNASDPNAQALELALDVDAGTIEATDDPSVWIYTP